MPALVFSSHQGAFPQVKQRTLTAVASEEDAVQVYLFVKLGTVKHDGGQPVSEGAQAVALEESGGPDLDGLTPSQRQSLYEAIVQEMIRVRCCSCCRK